MLPERSLIGAHRSARTMGSKKAKDRIRLVFCRICRVRMQSKEDNRVCRNQAELDAEFWDSASGKRGFGITASSMERKRSCCAVLRI